MIYITTIEHEENGEKLKTVIRVSLDDACKNGHAYFSVTASVYKHKRGSLYSREPSMGGCCHGHILELRPDLKPFVDLHLSDFEGTPLHAIANGHFHLTCAKDRTQEERIRITMDYLRATRKEVLELLAVAEDVTAFQYVLEKLQIPARWRDRADAAIRRLENLTHDKLSRASLGKGTYVPLSEETRAVVEKRFEEGYYTAEAVEGRRIKDIENKLEVEVASLAFRCKRETEQLTKETAVREYWVRFLAASCLKNPELTMDLADNPILYTDGRFRFNWKSYGAQVSLELANAFKDDVIKNDPPALKGVTVIVEDKETTHVK